jgi:exosortase A-associated hydrolase 1
VVNVAEKPVVFKCSDEYLFGILHAPESDALSTGVLIVVGGPQYRVGSHRQFVELARGLAQQGIPVFRFDCRGMGDSTGVFNGFEHLANDIRSAIDTFMNNMPSLQKLVIWGLCDGASAAAFYAPSDDRVAGLCLVNPWIRTEKGEAEAFVKHYYLSRVLSKAFWKKLFSGQLKIFQALGSFAENIKRALIADKGGASDQESRNADHEKLSLPVKLFRDLTRYSGSLLFIISGNDLTAAEFIDAVEKNSERKQLMKSSRVTMFRLPDADHTFSRRVWMKEVVEKTADWVKSL